MFVGAGFRVSEPDLYGRDARVDVAPFFSPLDAFDSFDRNIAVCSQNLVWDT